MEQHNLDKIFHDRLYHAQAEPPEFVWGNVEEALRRRRRRTAFLLLGSALLLTALVGLGFWAYMSDETASKRHLPAEKMPETGQNIVTNDGAAPTDAATASTPVLTTETAAAPARPAADLSAKSGETVLENFEHKKLINSNLDNSFISNKTQKLASQAAILPENKTRETAEAVNGAATETQIANAQNATDATDAAAAAAPKTWIGLPALASLETGYLSGKMPKHAVKPLRITRLKRAKKYKNCYDFASHPRIFMLDAYIGPSMAYKDLRVGAPESVAYRALRTATERQSWAFNGGINGSMLFHENFLLRAGLHYDQATEIFEYNDPKYREEVYKKRTTWVNGKEVITYDTSVVYGNKLTKIYNRFGMLELPVMAGIEMRKLRSGLSIQIGASLNMLFWKRGSILSPNNILSKFNTADNQADVFKNTLGLSLMGSVQWFYHVRPTLRIFAEPYYRHVLRPVTRDIHPVEQRYGVGSVKLGLTKILN